MGKFYKVVSRSIFLMICLFMVLSSTLFSVSADAKTYTATGWATKYNEQSIAWCRNGDYDVCNIHGDVHTHECPACGKRLVYSYVQNSYISNTKYRHVDYTVTVKKGKTCIVQFPSSKLARRAKIGQYQGYNWYDWAEKVSRIKYVAKYSGSGSAKKYSSTKIKVKCTKDCKFVLGFKNHKVVTLRVKVEK